MIITTIICALSIALFVGYTIIVGRPLKARCIASLDEDSAGSREELVFDLNSYHKNVCTLGVLSAIISVCAILSGVLM